MLEGMKNTQKNIPFFSSTYHDWLIGASQNMKGLA